MFADTYRALPEGSRSANAPNGSGESVSISASYVSLGGGSASATQIGSGALAVHASQALDVWGRFSLSIFQSALLASAGDLRFSEGAVGGTGVLHSPGTLTIGGTRIYPASGADFALISTATPIASGP